jgi:hypothetical protein
MTLRDYFAAKAMQSMTAGEGAVMVANRDGRYDETNWSTVVALNAYEMADAMLAVRSNQPSPDALQAENAQLRAAIQSALAASVADLNLSNYDAGDVERLNKSHAQVYAILFDALNPQVEGA